MNVENLVKFKLLNTPEVVEGLAKSKEGIPLIGINRGFEGTYPQIVLEMETGRDDLFADDKSTSKKAGVVDRGSWKSIERTTE